MKPIQPRTSLLAGLAIAALLALGAVARNADSAATPVANPAYNTFFPGDGVDLPTGNALIIGTLDLPNAGNYVVNAKLEVLNAARVDGRAIARCFLAPRRGAGDPPARFGEGDMATIDLERDRRGMLVLQFAAKFVQPEELALKCQDAGTSLATIGHITITATQVASLTSTQFTP